MKDWNLKQLVSVEAKEKEKVTGEYYRWFYIKGTKNIFGKVKLKEGFYYKEIGGVIKSTYTETCPEGYIFENGELYYDNNRVILTFVDGSVHSIKTASFDDAVALKEKIIKDCGKDFKKLEK